MLILISGRHAGAQSMEHQQGVSILSFINWREIFHRITQERFAAQTSDMGTLFIY